MTSLYVICGLGPPKSKILATPMCGIIFAIYLHRIWRVQITKRILHLVKQLSKKADREKKTLKKEKSFSVTKTYNKHHKKKTRTQKNFYTKSISSQLVAQFLLPQAINSISALMQRNSTKNVIIKRARLAVYR